MKIFEMNGKITKDIEVGIQRTEKYLNGWGDFAMFSDNVFIVLKKTMLHKERIRRTVKQIKK